MADATPGAGRPGQLGRSQTRLAISVRITVKPNLISFTGRTRWQGDVSSAPRIIYLQGYYCLTLIVGVDRSTDNRTPQSQLTYDVLADGRRIGTIADLGSESGVWSIQHLTHTGPDAITVKAVDAAGNRSAPSTGPSTTNVVPGYPC
jgi:hypothetical protein